MFGTIKRIIRWSGKYKGRLYLGAVCSFFSSFMTAAPTMIAAWALGGVLDSFWNHTQLPEHMVITATLSIILFIFLRFLLSYWKAVLQESIGYEVGASQRIRMGDVLKRVSLGYFSQNNVGDILARMTTELSALELQSMKMVDVVLNGYLQFLAVVLCLAFFSPAAALVAICGALFSALALAGISRRSQRTALKAHTDGRHVRGGNRIHPRPFYCKVFRAGGSISRKLP